MQTRNRKRLDSAQRTSIPAPTENEVEEARGRQQAFEAALRLLNRRERCEQEVRESLLAKEHDPEVVEDVVSELVELGAVDDRRYAEMFAADKRELSGWGPERIVGDLRKRGLPEAAIDAATAPDDIETQLERAIELLQRRGPGPSDDRERASALGYLTRRGYGYELAYEAVRQCSRGDLAA